jgi:basic membrane lipoprotein Med (substrate-binding protein (PBP1-ABC) superfamily)
VLNCSLLPSYHAVRSYYRRVYEAKFIIGAIAGAVCDNNRIGYIADYPVYGVPASVNAFALGARLTNPRAEVFVEWSTIKDHDPMETFIKNDVGVISNRDINAPSHHSMDFGLYLNKPGHTQNLAMPMWNWGQLYEDLLHSVQNGTWNSDALQNGAQALNYWWGMDSGTVDVFYSHKLDSGTRRLADLLREEIRSGRMRPFAESIFSQDGTRRCHSGKELTPAEIVAMDWLADNVVGVIPTLEDMKPEARAFVEVQGIHTIKAPDTSEMSWTDL